MKALTIRQPWAHAILHLGKNIENRKWPPPERLIGKYIAIHAGKGLDRESGLDVAEHELVRGAIVGIARIGKVVEDSRSRSFDGPLGWTLHDVRVLPKPIRRNGILGLWNVTPAELRKIRAAFPDLDLE